MPELAVLIPTRGRPDNIRKVISAWDFTNAWDHADMVLIVDADDPEVQGYRDIVKETEHPDSDQALITLLEIPVWMPMVHKLNLAAKQMADVDWPSPYFALGFAGDDHRPQTINWAARYLYVLRELGSGMVYGDDGYQGANLSTEWAITSDVVRAWGRMIPAGVEHMYCDNAILEAFTLAGAVRYLPEVRIEHHHPIVGKAESDEQYKRVNSSDQFRRDRAAFHAWQARERDWFVSQIKQLRTGLPMVRQPGKAAKRISRKAVSRVTKAAFPRWFKQVVGATPDDIAVTLADYAIRVPRDQEIVELGVFHGRTAIIMAWGAQQGNGAHVTAIDPWDLEGNVYDPPFNTDSPKRWAHHHIRNLGYSKHISLVQAFSTEAAARWSETIGQKEIGLLFVDGDHTKEGARDDITTWAPHLADGAVIAIDDYGHPDWPGVGEAVDELVAEGFLEPIQLFHDRLAVTRLATGDRGEETLVRTDDRLAAPVAITSEGVSPSPEVDPVDALFEGLSLPVSRLVRADVDTHVSSVPLGSDVQAGELEGVAAGTTLDELTVDQMKVLARRRGVSLGREGKTRAIALQRLKGAPQ